MGGLGLDFFGSLLSGGDIGKSLIGDISGGDPSKIFGSKPDVAPFTADNLSADTAQAIAGNLQNYDSITALLNKIVPGFSDLVSQGTSNALSELQGHLPDEVAAEVQRSSAYQALQGGYGGTGMGYANTARNLGLSALNLTQMGNNTAQLWTNIAEEGYSPFTVSTGQQSSTTVANNAGKQNELQNRYNVIASPDPSTLGQFQLDQHIGDQFLSFGLGAAGGAIAGGGGSQGQSMVYDPRTGQYVVPTSTPATATNDFRYAPTWTPGT